MPANRESELLVFEFIFGDYVGLPPKRGNVIGMVQGIPASVASFSGFLPHCSFGSL